MSQEYLLRLNIPPSLEEEFVDQLLSSDVIRGYQSYSTSGHGQVGAMSIAEQVAGRRNRIQFEIALEADAVKPLLQQLKAAFPTPDIIYWLIPIEESGRFS
jgi:hypothetical protein